MAENVKRLFYVELGMCECMLWNELRDEFEFSMSVIRWETRK
jgi:hypothetical protein